MLNATDMRELREIKQLLWGDNVREDVFKRWSQGNHPSPHLPIPHAHSMHHHPLWGKKRALFALGKAASSWNGRFYLQLGPGHVHSYLLLFFQLQSVAFSLRIETYPRSCLKHCCQEANMKIVNTPRLYFHFHISILIIGH